MRSVRRLTPLSRGARGRYAGGPSRASRARRAAAAGPYRCVRCAAPPPRLRQCERFVQPRRERWASACRRGQDLDPAQPAIARVRHQFIARPAVGARRGDHPAARRDRAEAPREGGRGDSEGKAGGPVARGPRRGALVAHEGEDDAQRRRTVGVVEDRRRLRERLGSEPRVQAEEMADHHVGPDRGRRLGGHVSVSPTLGRASTPSAGQRGPSWTRAFGSALKNARRLSAGSMGFQQRAPRRSMLRPMPFTRGASGRALRPRGRSRASDPTCRPR